MFSNTSPRLKTRNRVHEGIVPPDVFTPEHTLEFTHPPKPQTICHAFDMRILWQEVPEPGLARMWRDDDPGQKLGEPGVTRNTRTEVSSSSTRPGDRVS